MITVRLAGPEDAAAIAHVHVAGWQHYRGLMPDSYLDALDPAVHARRWEARLTAPEQGEAAFTYVADDPPGRVIGFVHGSREEESDEPALGEVRAIYVLAERRGDGAGRRLTTATVSRLAQIGCRALVIWVLTENHSARRFYEALGGRAAHERVREIGGAELPETGYRWDSLGAFLRPVVIVPSDPGWAAALEAERRRVANALGWPLADVEPIGSTSVPGLAAKPILDLMGGVPELPVGRDSILAAARLGYDYHGAAGIPGRQYFSRPALADALAAHLHVAARNGEFWERHLRFRDYLRTHPQVAAEYGALKQKLAAAAGTDRIAYLEGKGPFITAVLARAEREAAA
jgi:GrpB-like predicted nucleotidyltransferase (UPF0157 family)/GNAT superfamily N-acetyltransferase